MITAYSETMEWPSLWVCWADYAFGRDIETNEITLYGSDDSLLPEHTRIFAQLRELDKVHRVLCVNCAMSIVRTEAGLYEHFGGSFQPMSDARIQRTIDVWRFSDISSVLYYKPYEDTGNYRDLNLDLPVIDEAHRWCPRFLLLEDGSVYEISKKAIVGQVYINKRQIKQPGNDV